MNERGSWRPSECESCGIRRRSAQLLQPPDLTYLDVQAGGLLRPGLVPRWRLGGAWLEGFAPYLFILAASSIAKAARMIFSANR